MAGHYDILKTLIEAWKRSDLDTVASLLADDIVWHYAAAIAPPLEGKAAAVAFLTNFRGTMGEVTWRIFHHAESGPLLFLEGVDEYVGNDGVRVAAPYAGVLEFRDGKVCAWRDYLDMGLVTRMKAGTPVPDYVEALIARPAV